MALSKTDICNHALLKVGADIVASLDVDINSTEGTVETALLCNVLFDQSLDELLRLYQWNCCTKRATPNKLTSVPDWKYAGEFELPNDYIRLLTITDDVNFQSDDIEWVVEGGKILCDYAQIYIRYIARPENVGNLDPLASKALICLLASKLAVPLQQDDNLAQRLTNELYQVILPEARSIDTFENYDLQLPESQWITARRYTYN
jgi:hypothetical protein